MKLNSKNLVIPSLIKASRCCKIKVRQAERNTLGELQGNAAQRLQELRVRLVIPISPICNETLVQSQR